MKLYPSITLIFTTWAIAILSVFYLGFSQIKPSGLFDHDFIKNLANWDGGHFLGIADGGYDETFQYAFFPLYPLVISILEQTIGSFLFAGILISLISAFFGVHFFYLLVKEDYGEQIAKNSLIYLLLFPTSFYLLTVYTESLFFLLSLAAFYFARKNKLFISTVFASLSGATRLAGLGVGLSLWLVKRNWIFFFASLGFLAYCIYLYFQTGDPLYFIRAENYWERRVVLPGYALLALGYKFWDLNFLLSNYNLFIDFIFTVFGLLVLTLGAKKIKKEYLVFSFFSILLPLFSPTLLAIPRYLLVIFPIFIIIGSVKNEYFKFSYQLLSSLLLAGFSIMFISGYWVS